MFSADLAQWQSNAFVKRRFRVQVPGSAPDGGVAEWSIALDCKSSGRVPTQVRILPPPQNDQKIEPQIEGWIKKEKFAKIMPL